MLPWSPSHASPRGRFKRPSRGCWRSFRTPTACHPPLLVGVLKGSFVFLFEIDFVRVRSYGSSMRASAAVEILKGVEVDVRGRHVVVEDSLDTGAAMRAVLAPIACLGEPLHPSRPRRMRHA